MKRADVAIVCCPRCHGDLDIEATREERDDIIEGKLKCKPCGIDYAITERIAQLIAPGHKIEAGYGGYDDWP